MKKLGVGVIGVGEMGRQHAENMRRQVPEARLVAIADVSAERGKQVADELEIDHAYTSMEEMLQRKDIDAVVISTPDAFHAAGIKAAAAAGKDILCEKPLALTVDDAKAALKDVSGAGVRLQVGFMRRYDPAYAAAMKHIESGEIGTPVVFKSVGRDKDQPPMAAYESGVNGMLFYSNTIHDFDLARWLMHDEVTDVHSYITSTIRPEVAKYGDIVAGVVNMQFSKGAIGNIDSNVQACYAYDVRTEIVGSKGSIFIGSLQGAPATFMTPSGGNAVLADHFLSRFANAYLTEARDFAHMVLSGKAPRITGEDGLKALEIAVAAERSGKTSQPCKVGHEVSA